MKSWHMIILLCLLATALDLLSSSSSSTISLSGRKSLKMSLPHYKNRYHNAKVVDEAAWESSGKSLMGLQYSNMDEEDEIVNYHIDYHGVTTHPTPTPKHPNSPNP
ncbi:hypothetical protein PTKIN_Ptkin09bG0090300 [Pterospermum kingtungense]